MTGTRRPGRSPSAGPAESAEMREIELKFLLEEQPAAIWARARRMDPAFTRPRTRTLVSVYYDTPDRKLRGAGIVLRIRRDGRRWFQTVKAGRNTVGGFTDVQEVETAAKSERPDLQSVPDQKLREKLVELCQGRELVPVSAMQFRRSSGVIVLPDAAKVEISTDVGTISASDLTAPWRELEIERIEGSPRALFDVAAALHPDGGLRFSRLSKSARAILLAEEGRVEPLPVPRCAAKVPLAPAMSAEHTARDVLRECAGQIVANIDVVRETDRPEGPHQLRIGLRRLRSWLLIFQPLALSAEMARLSEEARWLAGEVGSLRDLDVTGSDIVGPEAERHPDEPALAALAQLAASRATSRREALRRTLRDRRVQAFELDLIRFVELRGWIEEGDLDQSRRLSTPVEVFASEALARRWKKVLKCGRGLNKLDTAHRHELRKQLKKLRYAIEFFAPLHETKRCAVMTERLKALQDVFGQLNDAAMVRGVLAGPEFVAPADAQMQRAVGWVLGATGARAEQAWTKASKLWRKLKRSRPFWQ